MAREGVVINQHEANQIAQAITPIFAGVLNEYDFGKYPADPYANFQMAFSMLAPTQDDIENALIWKWGHWGKENIPQHQQALIEEIQDAWQPFLASGQQQASSNTYRWWWQRLNRAYISVAYITHLIHYQEPLPIIDQHNFRAMNAFVINLRPGFRFKKKPSQWEDIQAVYTG
jgi:hypothetical protein